MMTTSTPPSRAVVLVSGGLDSAVALAWAVQQFKRENLLPISFFYGQRHHKERDAAYELCEMVGITLPVNVELAQPFIMIGGSSLTSAQIDSNPSTEPVQRTPSDLPPTFVPGRNLIFLGVAAAYGYTEQAYNIVGGWNAVDYSGYPDCRDSFLKSAEQTLTLALDHPILIHAPLLARRKDEIIKLGMELGVPFEKTWSCYAGTPEPCGECDSCKIRAEGFARLGLDDPALVHRTDPRRA